MENSGFSDGGTRSGVFPVIDLGSFGGSAMEPYEKLREACEENGLFRLINHGIPPSLMSEMKSVAGALFDRPIEIKRRNVDTIVSSGYLALSKDSPLCEALGFHGLGSAEAQRSFCDQLYASPHERDVIEKYSEAVHKLVMDMGRKLAKSMGLDGDWFNEWPCQIRMNKYHFSPETLGVPAMRTHTDSGFLAILQDDEIVEGLDVIDRSSGKFEAVHPWPDTFLLMLGDVAKAWSNGRFSSVTHTVNCKKSTTRFSIASFLLGPNQGTVEAPSELVDNEHPRLYAPFIYEDYRELRLSKRLLTGEALELIQMSNPI